MSVKDSRQVFISYGREPEYGTPFAIELRDRILSIKEPELNVFLDTANLKDGEQWQLALERQIDDSFLMIVLCSEKANNSEHVKFEWQYAMGAKKKIIAIKIQEDKTPIPSQLMRFHSASLNFLNPTEDDWQSLLDAIIDVFNETHIPTHVQTARDFAEHPLEDYREQALQALRDNEHPQAIEALADLCQNSYLPEVRWLAARHLVDKARDERAIKELQERLNGRYEDFDIAVERLKQIGTEAAYKTLADHYIHTDFRDKKYRILSQFNEMPLPEIESHMIRCLKHRDDDHRAPNKFVLLKWLAEAGNTEILLDIEEFLLNNRPDIQITNETDRLHLITEHMQGYKNTQDVIPIYTRLIENHFATQTQYSESIAIQCLTALVNRPEKEVTNALKFLLEKRHKVTTLKIKDFKGKIERALSRR